MQNFLPPLKESSKTLAITGD